MGAGKIWRRRFGCALALVLAPLLALALGQPMGEAMLPGAPGELEPDVGLRAAWEAPNWFAEEVVDVNGREELRANDDWSVVSFVEEGDGLPDRHPLPCKGAQTPFLRLPSSHRRIYLKNRAQRVAHPRAAECEP